ncbi:MAG: hypothetical protein ACREGJ_01300 [Candidatus Saccharimonadales bacterium]
MAIVELPEILQAQIPLACSICRVNLLLSKATAGLFDADNQQAFACVSHFSEVELLIVGWADFIAVERRKRKRRELEAEALYGKVGTDAWFNP